MTPAQVRTAIAAGTTAPIYLLESDDVPSRLELSQAFLGLVEEGLEAFNTASFHAREATNAGDRDAMLSAILSAARTLPMMAPRRVLLVHDAEALLAPKRAKDEDPADAPAVPGTGKRRPRSTTPAEDFEAYVEHPEPLTTLVLDAPSLDRGRRITKLLLKHALVVDCGTLDTPADAARWIKTRLDRDEMTMDGAAITALIDAAGLRLPRIRSAIDKLVLYAAGEGAITATHVRDVKRRDRLLLICAMAMTLLTVLGAAGESLGMDRILKANTVTTRTHSLFRQGCHYYAAIPAMRQELLEPLVQRFGEYVLNQPVYVQAFGLK